ncbi:unnamed protein product, partial [Cyprideis torosa]
MFYSPFVLSKKGPFAKIWLAAHWDKKLTKAQIFEINVKESVEDILHPKVKLALRTTGHLLVGIVRIYSRKTKYLLQDCNEAFVKIKMAFRPGMVDLPEEGREAPSNQITLPEVFHDFDTSMPELSDMDIQAQFSLNQSRAEEITLREDFSHFSEPTTVSDNFGDFGSLGSFADFRSGASATELLREQQFGDEAGLPTLDGGLSPHHPSTTAGELGATRKATVAATTIGPTLASPQPGPSTAPDQSASLPLPDTSDLMGANLFESGLFDDVSLQHRAAEDVSAEGGAQEAAAPVVAPETDHDDDDIPDFGGPATPLGGASSHGDDSRPTTPRVPTPTPEEPPVPAPAPEDQTILLRNEEESFALAPVDPNVVKGVLGRRKKRKLIVDEVKNISGEEMKAQLADTTDIVTTLDLAPPTKRLKMWKETGGVEKLFATSGRANPKTKRFKAYNRMLAVRTVETEDLQKDPLDEPQQPPAPAAAPTGRRGRKRKGVEPVPEEEEPAPTPLDKRRLVASTPAVAPEPAPAATPAAAPQNVPMANMGYDATAAAAAEQPPPEQPRTPWSTRAPGTPFESNPPSVAAPQLPGEDEE